MVHHVRSINMENVQFEDGVPHDGDGSSMNTSMLSRPEKIVHVIGALAAGGAERFVVSLICELKVMGYDVSLLVLSSKQDAVGRQMSSVLARCGVRVASGPTIRVGFRSVIWYIQELLCLAPTVVHLHTPNTELAHFLARQVYWRSHKITRTLHSTRFPNSLFIPIALRRNVADISIACGQAAASVFQTHIPGRIVSIRNGIRFDWPIRDTKNSDIFKAELQLDHHRTHFVSVGSMRGDKLSNSPKAHGTLLQAWRQSGLGGDRCQLHLIGDGPLRGQLQQMAGADNSIRFHGVQHDVYKWLLASDCFVMPSRWEGLPIAAIEAVGTGLPCILSDISPLRELGAPVVQWVTVDDASSLAYQLQKFTVSGTQPNRKDVEAFRNEFEINEVAKKYADVYETLCILRAGCTNDTGRWRHKGAEQ